MSRLVGTIHGRSGRIEVSRAEADRVVIEVFCGAVRLTVPMDDRKAQDLAALLRRACMVPPDASVSGPEPTPRFKGSTPGEDDGA